MIVLRQARDSDGESFLALMAASWAEMPGPQADPAAWAPELRAPAGAAASRDGMAWAAERDGEVVGFAVAWPDGSGEVWELNKLYVAAAHRDGVVAATLLATVELHARERGGLTLRLWSDARLARGHAFYEKHSFVRAGPLRADQGACHVSYVKPLAGLAVRTLDAAGAESAIPRLADILMACVADGASVSFMPPLERDRARAFWRQKAREVAIGTRVLLAAWWQGRLIGCVSLDLATPENQPHRAEVQKMLVEPAGRRRGAARALLLAAETAARAAGRSLLTLDTDVYGAASSLYLSTEWLPVGVMPGYALMPDGSPCDTQLFYKILR